MTFEKLDGFTFNHSNQPDDLYKTMSAAEVKQKFDSRGEELKEAFNALVEGLNTPKNTTEEKLADDSVSRRTIQSGAVGLDELDPAITAQPLTDIGQQAKFLQIDNSLEDKATKSEVATKANQSDLNTANTNISNLQNGKADKATTSDLQSQINSLVVGSGTASADDVQARSDLSGNTFPTLKAHLNNVEKSISNYVNRKYLYEWAVGRLDNGALNNGFKAQIAMNRIEYADKDILVSMSDYSLYQHNVQTFNSSGAFLSGGGWLAKDYTIPAGTYFKIALKKPSDTTTVLTDPRASELYTAFSATADGSFRSIDPSSSKDIDVTGSLLDGNVIASTGVYTSGGTTYKRTGFIPVIPNDVGLYTGYLDGTDTTTYNGVTGYDKFMNPVGSVLNLSNIPQQTGYTNVTDFPFTIPNNVYYIMASHRVSGASVSLKVKMKGTIKSALTKIVNIQDESQNLKLGFVTKYSSNEEDLYNKVVQKQTSDYLTFMCVADDHAGVPNWDDVYYHGKIAVKLAEKMGVDFTLHLGDSFTDVDDVSENFKRLMRYMKPVQQSFLPFVYVNGNHETFIHNTGSGNYPALNVPQIWGATNRFGRYFNFVHDFNNPASLYYYFDEPTRKVRNIVLDSSSNGNCGFSDAQVSWLSSVLSSVPSGYQVLFFTHIPPFQNLVATSTTTIVNGTNIISTIQNFVNSGGKVLAMLHGHVHVDNLYVEPTLKFPIIAIVCSMPGKQASNGFPPSGNPTAWDRAYGTYTQYAFDTFCINVKTGEINMFRFGAGADRTFTPA